MKHKLFCFLCLTGLLSAFSGCSEVNPRREVSGMINFKGAALDQGTIEFHPISGSTPGVPATMEGATIAKGEYKILAEAGLVPGKYKVIISSGDGIDPNNPEGIPGPTGNYVSKDRIPADYNTATKQQVEVTDKGPNKFDFDIK